MRIRARSEVDECRTCVGQWWKIGKPKNAEEESSKAGHVFTVFSELATSQVHQQVVSLPDNAVEEKVNA